MPTNVEVNSSHQVANEEICPTRQYAQDILIRNAVKSYGIGKNRCEVLKGLDMSVKKGTM